MVEEEFELPLDDGVLVGHHGGEGRPALILHGGPALSDYTDELAAELGELFATIRYTQRGTPPSAVGPPYSIESHVADALSVLDHFGIERAWAVGHSNRSLAVHLEARTLANGLPGVRLPALFIHGELDPMPVRSSTDTAALIPDAVAEVIPGCGHFPWLEKPGEVRRLVERFVN